MIHNVKHMITRSSNSSPERERYEKNKPSMYWQQWAEKKLMAKGKKNTGNRMSTSYLNSTMKLIWKSTEYRWVSREYCSRNSHCQLSAALTSEVAVESLKMHRFDENCIRLKIDVHSRRAFFIWSLRFVESSDTFWSFNETRELFSLALFATIESNADTTVRSLITWWHLSSDKIFASNKNQPKGNRPRLECNRK